MSEADVGSTKREMTDDGVEASHNPTVPDLKSVLVTSVLNLEKLDIDLYRGKHHWIPRTRRLFGGQIVGQALVAAAKSVGDDVYAHSLHCYFVRAGDPKVPVLYQVERTRDGRSFSVRSTYSGGADPAIPQGLNKILADEVPIEIKPVNPPDFYRRVAMEPKKLFWVRAKGHIGEEDMKLHCCVAAYVSDYSFLGTAMLPYPKHRAQFSASLDHAMWFHNKFRADQWMLYECESPWAGGSRGLVQGRLWREDGVLAASCAQEGVLRVKDVTQSKL
ncbi:acyl-coenzyme A thioesterase 8 isoform X2 [Brachyhypopomus gauderio]|uniref:acyl-coenzyme A thioesterase 8 isoform X2 n=1 Tax=Brachyhypopomus gauderio TaxID=698409 RepID=UPI0040425041